MKKIITIIAAFALCFTFSGCGSAACDHQWRDASCKDPVTCILCGETAGNPLGHHWVDANCTTPKTCDICGATEGEPLGHSWKDATYEAPKTCTVCGTTEGSALTRPTTRTCAICGEILEDSQILYCSTHGCAMGGCSYQAKHVNCTWGQFCEFHSCHYPGCVSTPIGGTNFCGAHGGFN